MNLPYVHSSEGMIVKELYSFNISLSFVMVQGWGAGIVKRARVKLELFHQIVNI